MPRWFGFGRRRSEGSQGFERRLGWPFVRGSDAEGLDPAEVEEYELVLALSKSMTERANGGEPAGSNRNSRRAEALSQWYYSDGR